MKQKYFGSAIRFCLASALLFSASIARLDAAGNEAWRGVHLWLDNDFAAQSLVKTLPALAAAGANTLVLEINYSFEFQTHPELRNKRFVTHATAQALAAAARKCSIRLIPEFNCLGHQSFGRRIEPLLKLHPELSETPLGVLTETNFYCLSWCPRADGVNEIVFALIDEMTEAFGANAVHVGMDEVYFIGDDRCARCRGMKPAELFAAQVNALHAHIVGEKKWRMLMWADRVIGPQFQGYSQFDNVRNDTSAVVDLIPKDIVMCDWHYEAKKSYPSLPYLAGKGFSVWPAGFAPLKSTAAFSDFALTQKTNVISYLATTWNQTSISNAPAWPPITEILPRWKN